ncbi:MAG: hypothetical protein OXU20_05745 [Myxococcales bacterium]|nr:hypothetical protein [Myxococcales bacterium]MDD9969995.1 hypothetical protein [Myxococcales bacterium]
MDINDSEARKLRIARRIALVIGTIVGLIFMGAGTLGYIYFAYDRPAKEVLLGSSEPEAGP